jgi:hypothetical protein
MFSNLVIVDGEGRTSGLGRRRRRGISRGNDYAEPGCGVRMKAAVHKVLRTGVYVVAVAVLVAKREWGARCAGGDALEDGIVAAAAKR